MSTISQGLSMKGPKPSNGNKIPFKNEDDETSCCYNRCYRKKYLNGYVRLGYFKSSYDCGLCTLITMMITCFILAVVTPVVINSIIDSAINSQVVIDSTSAPNYDAWQNNINGPGTDVKIGYDIYFFDLQNPSEVLNGAKPIVVERGPYAYNEFYNKFDITWSDGGDTVTYNTQRYYIFDPLRSGAGLSENDEITLPYPSALGFQYILSKIPYNATVLAEELLQAELYQLYGNIEASLQQIDDQANSIIIHRKIVALEAQVQTFYQLLSEFVAYSNPADLAFKGFLCKTGNLQPFWKTNPTPAYFGWFNDPLLVEVQNLLDVIQVKTGVVVPWSTAVPGVTTNYTTVDETRRRRGKDTLKTGKKDPKQVSRYVRYNNMTELWSCTSPMDSQNTSQYIEGQQFPACALYQYEWTSEEAEKMGYSKPFLTPYANRIEGTDANMFGRPVTSSKVQVFISDIYRSAYLQYSKDVSWYDISVRRFQIQVEDLQNATINPSNAQYFNFGPSGMENLTAATGVPSWVSFPNFLYGQTSLVADIEGVIPNEDIHTSYLDIEPQTGLLVGAQKRLQANYQMTTQTFPVAPNTTAATLHDICVNFASIIETVKSQGIKLNISTPQCNNTMIEGLFTCLSTPSDWKMQNDEVYMPYSWVQEHFTLPQSSADDLNNSLFAIQNLASQVQYWCLVIGATLGAMIATAVYTRYVLMKDIVSRHGSALENEFEYSYKQLLEEASSHGTNAHTESSAIDTSARGQDAIRSPLI